MKATTGSTTSDVWRKEKQGRTASGRTSWSAVSLAFDEILTDAVFFFCSQLKDAIIHQMSSVKVTSLEQVTQMSAVVALATNQKDEISPDSQV